MTPSTAPKGLKFRRMLLEMLLTGIGNKRFHRGRFHDWCDLGPKVTKWLERRLIDPPRYQGTLTDRELGSWRVSAKLTLELAGQTHEEVDWQGAFWELAWLGKRAGVQADSTIDLRRHTKLVPNGEHLKMKAGDLLRLLDAVEGR